MNDLRYALRTFARSPGLVAAAIVCLALGIGANATIFGVVDTLLFRPPAHVKDPGQVVRLYFRTHSPTFGTFTSSVRSYALYKLIRDSAHAFSEVAALAGTRATSLGRGPEAREAQVDLVSGSFFSLLGVKPALGRFYGVDEDRLGGAQVVVLSDAFWRREFGGDAGVLGRALRLGQNLYTVIGVAPKGFTGVNLEVVDVWAPLAVATPDVMGGASWLNHQSFFVAILGRLRPGATAAQATREATAAFRVDAAQVPDWHLDPDDTALLGPVQQARGPEMSRDAKVSTWPAAVSAIVLLIACAGVATGPRGLDARPQGGCRGRELPPLPSPHGTTGRAGCAHRRPDRGRRAVRAQPARRARTGSRLRSRARDPRHRGLGLRGLPPDRDERALHTDVGTPASAAGRGARGGDGRQSLRVEHGHDRLRARA